MACQAAVMLRQMDRRRLAKRRMSKCPHRSIDSTENHFTADGQEDDYCEDLNTAKTKYEVPEILISQHISKVICFSIYIFLFARLRSPKDRHSVLILRNASPAEKK